jgi:hypothetical protein
MLPFRRNGLDGHTRGTQSTADGTKSTGPLFLPMKSDDEKRDLDRALRKAQDIRFRPATAAKRAPYQDEQANRLAPGLFSRIS